MTLPIWAYTAVGSLLAGALGGWTVRDWKADSDALEATEAEWTQYTAFTELLADQSLQLENTQQQLRAGERRDRETIREIYRDVQVPVECAVPAGAVSVLGDAIDRANAAAAGKSGGEVSGSP